MMRNWGDGSGRIFHQGIDTEWNRNRAVLSAKLPALPPILTVMSHLNSFPRHSRLLKIAPWPTINTTLLLKIQTPAGRIIFVLVGADYLKEKFWLTVS